MINALNVQQKWECKQNVKRDNKLLYLIHGAIDQIIIFMINGPIHSNKAWKILSDAYRGMKFAKL